MTESMSFLEFPTYTEWKEIYSTSPFPPMIKRINKLITGNKNNPMQLVNPMEFVGDMEILNYLTQASYRLYDVARSYVFLISYYRKGIPDDEWVLSPGKDGVSIQYFPHFTKPDFFKKEWFDFYSDVFYYKLFSAWDIVGHILDKKYDLQNSRPDFHKSVNTLKSKDEDLHEKFDAIRKNSSFTLASKLRNDITHNFLPYSVGLRASINKTKTKANVGIGPYTTSKEIVQNMVEIIALFDKTLEYIELIL